MKSADVKKAAAFAVSKEYPKLTCPRYTIQSAMIQMVAGTNYKIKVAVKQRTVPKTCLVSEYVVFEDFQKKYTLTSKTITARTC